MSEIHRKLEIETEDQPPKKRSGWKKFLLALLILLLVLAVVFVAAWRDGTGFDALHRYFNYGSTAESGETVYYYDTERSNHFAILGSHLVVLSNTSLRLLAPDGSEVWSANVKMSSPALAKGGNYVAAYDVGGQTLYVLDETGERLHLEKDAAEPLISATLNSKGMLAVTSGERTRKGLVSVYSAEMKLMFEFKSSHRFVVDAYACDDGKYLAAVTLGQENSDFVSNVVLYDLTEKKDPVADYDITDGLVMAVGGVNGKLAAVTDTALVFADASGEIIGSYRYTEPYLREFDLGGTDFAALLLNRYKSGSVGRLVTVDTAGTEIAALDVSQEVLSMSACGRYLAVLYTDRLVIYNRDLQIYATLHGIGSIGKVLARSDGSVVLLSADSAELFLP